MLTYFVNFDSFQGFVTLLCFLCCLAASAVAVYIYKGDNYRATFDGNFNPEAKKAKDAAVFLFLLSLAIGVFGWPVLALFFVGGFIYGFFWVIAQFRR